MTPAAALLAAAMRGAARGAVLAAGVACASPGAPPGGPQDRNAPLILKVTPDSGARNVKERSVTVRFNEVVSERPRSGPDLNAVVVLSPSDGRARVQWHRSAITVRPREGFRPNTAYSVTLMPGIADLSGNAIVRERTFVFSTGGGIPAGVVRGAVFDWTTLKPAGGALVDARIGADTAFRWIARTDSAGWYTIPLLPEGTYTLRAIIDANANGRLDARELWDSTTVSVRDSLRADLYGFVHDTIGPRVVGADVRDSLTLRLGFDRPLALAPALEASQVAIVGADSSVVPVRAVLRASAFDSLARVREQAARDSTQRADTSAAGRAARAREDSLRIIAQRDSIERARVEARRAARDTVSKRPPPVPARAMVTADFVAVLAAPLSPGTYRVAVRDAKSVAGITRSSDRTFTRAKPAERKGEDGGKATPPSDAGAGTPAAATGPPTKPPPQ
jgi:hypothetical protein